MPLCTVTIRAGEVDSTSVDVSRNSAGSVPMPAEFTGNQIAVHVSNRDGYFRDIRHAANTNFSVIYFGMNMPYELPDPVFKFHTMRLQSNERQDADREIGIFLKE